MQIPYKVSMYLTYEMHASSPGFKPGGPADQKPLQPQPSFVCSEPGAHTSGPEDPLRDLEPQ